MTLHGQKMVNTIWTEGKLTASGATKWSGQKFFKTFKKLVAAVEKLVAVVEKLAATGATQKKSTAISANEKKISTIEKKLTSMRKNDRIKIFRKHLNAVKKINRRSKISRGVRKNIRGLEENISRSMVKKMVAAVEKLVPVW